MRPTRAQWRAAHLWLGVVMGAALGLGGQTIVANAEHVAAIAPRPLAWFALVALLVGGGISLFAIGLGELLWPLGTRRPRAVALAEAALLALLCALHAAGIGVRALAGDYPSVAGYQMLLASPVQFVSQALSGYRWAATGLAIGAAVCFAFVYAWLARPRPAISQRGFRAAAALSALTVVGSSLAARAIDPHGLAHATPELALHSTFGPLFERERSTPSGDQVGPPRALHESWLEELRGNDGPRPNVILLVLESIPADHVGYLGYAREVTPNLDALARNSLRMRRVWSVATQSNYAQMAILSSLHPRRRRRLDLYEELAYPRILPHDVFARLGYATATISSQNEDWQGMRRFQSTETATTFLDSSTHPGPHIGAGFERKLPDHLTTDVLLDWLEQIGDQPFQVYVNLQRTHFPYDLPDGVAAPYRPAKPDPDSFGYLAYPERDRAAAINRFDNALRYVDAQIGRIRRALEQRDLLDDTLWVIVADHGELFGEHGLVTHGKSLFEQEARVPLLLHWPGHLRAADSYVPISTLDIMPTVLDLLGLPPHPSYQGTSFKSLRGRMLEQRGIYLTLQGLRYADAVVCWPWKLIHESSHSRLLLFDLERDPREQHNLIERERPRARVLTELLLRHVERQVAYHADLKAQRDHFAPPLLPCP